MRSGILLLSSIPLTLSPQSHGHTDKVWMKVYIFVSWALDTVHQIILLRTGYIALVEMINSGSLPFGDRESLFDSYQS